MTIELLIQMSFHRPICGFHTELYRRMHLIYVITLLRVCVQTISLGLVVVLLIKRMTCYRYL